MWASALGPVNSAMQQTTTTRQDVILSKLQRLSPEKLDEVEDFVDFLAQRAEDAELVRAALTLASPLLQQIWDNDEDGVYDNL